MKVSSIDGRGPDQLYRVWKGLDPIPVISSNARTVAIEPALHLIFVQFKTGLYCWKVPPEVAVKVLTAPSVGTAVFDALRGGDGRRGNRKLDLDNKYEWLQVE